MKKLSLGAVHYGYVIIFCCCLIMGVNVGIVMSCAGIFYQPVSEELGVSAGAFGLYMSCNYLTSTLLLPVAGRLMERYSVRVLLTLSSAVLGSTLIGMSFFSAVWQFYIAGGVIGCTLAFLLYLSFPTLVNRWFKVKVGFWIGVCSAASGIGGMLLNPVGAHLITNYGWRTTYIIFGSGILLLVTPLLGLLLKDHPDSVKSVACSDKKSCDNAATEAVGVEYAQALKMSSFYMIWFFAFLMVAVSTLNLFIPNYMLSIGYTFEQAALVAAAVMLGVTVGKVLLGMLNDRSCVWGVGVTAVCGILGLSFLLFNGGIAVTVVGGFLFGWAYAGVTVQTPMLVRTVFGSKNYAQIYSNISVAFAVGGVITAGGWGLVTDHTGFRFVFSLGIFFLILSGVFGFYVLRIRK